MDLQRFRRRFQAQSDSCFAGTVQEVRIVFRESRKRIHGRLGSQLHAFDVVELHDYFAQKKFREAALDETAELIKKFLRDASALTLKIDVDRKKNDLSLSLDLTARSGSAMI